MAVSVIDWIGSLALDGLLLLKLVQLRSQIADLLLEMAYVLQSVVCCVGGRASVPFLLI